MAAQTRANWDAIQQLAEVLDSKVTEHFPSLQKSSIGQYLAKLVLLKPQIPHHQVLALQKSPSSYFLLPTFSFLQEFLPLPLKALTLFAYFNS